jgi:hypothetical protein
MIPNDKVEVLAENLSQFTLSTPNPTWTGLTLNPGFQGDSPASNHMIHRMAPQRVSYLGIDDEQTPQGNPSILKKNVIITSYFLVEV